MRVFLWTPKSEVVGDMLYDTERIQATVKRDKANSLKKISNKIKIFPLEVIKKNIRPS